MKRAYALLVLAPAVLALSGCGYHAGYTARGDIHSVAVPVFGNDTFYRSIEIDLTNDVVSQIEKKTPYRLADSSSADATLEGRIIAYTKTVLAEDKNDKATDTDVVLVVDVRLVDRGGRVLAKEIVRIAQDFSISSRESELLLKEQNASLPPGQRAAARRDLAVAAAMNTGELGARNVAVRRAAERIVERIFESDW